MNQTGRQRLLTPLLLSAVLTAALACGSNNNNTAKNTGAVTKAPAAAASAAPTTASTAAAPATTAAAAAATSAATIAAAGTPTGGTITVTPGIVNADKALAAAAGSGSPVDQVTIGKPVSIDFWHTQPQGPNGDKLNALIKDFQAKNPNITINAQYVGNYNDLFQKLQTAVAGGKAPELAVGYANQVAEYQQANVVVPLEDYVKSKTYGLPKDDYADILPAYRYDQFYSAYDNKLLSFPFTKSIELMYYNADKLKDAGVAVPQTWDDFLKAAKAVSKGDVKGYAIGVEPSLFANMVFSRGGQEISDDGKKWVFNNQQGVDSLALFQQLIKDGSGYQIAKQFADQTDFGAGKAVFTFSTSAGLPYYQKEVADNGKFNWSVAAPPHAPGQDTAAVINGANITMFKSSAEKQLAAWLLIKYFASKEVNPDWSTASGYLPIRTSGLSDERVKAQVAKLPQYGIALQVQANGRSEPGVRSYQAARNHIADAIVAALADANKSAKALLDDAVKQSNDDAAK